MRAMQSAQQMVYRTIVFTGLLFSPVAGLTLEFQPGVGAGLEYTDNARLSPDETVDDLVAASYVGARIFESDGSLKYDANAGLNKNNYTKGTFENQRYFNLAARADWEMIKDSFNWFLSDNYSQLPIRSINANNPDNTQDSNVFTFGADTQLRISARQSFSFTPMYSQYYYEVLTTDNNQYSLAANWNYQMFRLTNVGLNLSARKINYTETNILGQSIAGTTFTTLGFTFNGQRLRSSFAGNLGTTNVKRDNGDETSGFSGFLNWFVDLSSRSKFETSVSTDLTDTSSVAFSSAAGSGVQITADVVRSSLINLAYIREDASLNTRVSARYNKLKYSENPLNRIIRDFNLLFSYPVTQLLSSGTYINYNRIKQLDTNRLDKQITAGVNLRYRFSRKIYSLFDLKYRTRESTTDSQNFDEFTVFVSLVYGFGDVRRPTRVGGF